MQEKIKISLANFGDVKSRNGYKSYVAVGHENLTRHIHSGWSLVSDIPINMGPGKFGYHLEISNEKYDEMLKRRSFFGEIGLYSAENILQGELKKQHEIAVRNFILNTPVKNMIILKWMWSKNIFGFLGLNSFFKKFA